MEAKIAYLARRLEGQPPEQLVQQRLGAASSAFGKKIEETERLFEQLIERGESIDWLRAAKSQSEGLKQAIELLRRRAKELNSHLKGLQGELVRTKKQREELIGLLVRLKEALSEIEKSAPYEELLLACGENLSGWVAEKKQEGLL